MRSICPRAETAACVLAGAFGGFDYSRELRAITLLLGFLFTVCAAWPQGNDVRIQPRTKAESPNLAAESGSALQAHTKPFVSDVNLVLVPVSVSDPVTRFITGLKKENFRVLENNVPQEIEYFYSEDAPISVGVIFDTSSSMAGAVNDARQAVVEFMKTSNPDDEFFLISFSNTPRLLRDFTERHENIQSELVYTVPTGQTALLDAIYLGMSKMQNAKYPRKALLIISDGGENHSRYTPSEIQKVVREADVQIYAIGIAGADYEPGFLRAITEGTGGRAFGGSDLVDTAEKISIELRNQYVIGYSPRNLVHDGKWRKIRVNLRAPKGLPPLRVSARAGYYVPSE